MYTYAKAGVDIIKADRFVDAISRMVRSTLNKRVQKSIGGYASLYQLSQNEYLAATTDGVGTKLKLAFETNQHHTIGIDLVAMSANDLICIGATPLFFLDYFATGKLHLSTAKSVMKGIVKGCKLANLALVGGETAEMPGIYAKGEYDLAGFAVGLVKKNKIIDGSNVKPGDVILGIESSGPHSNGFSLIRKTADSQAKKNRSWILKQSFVPTRIYVKAIQALHQKIQKNLKGLAHITGSGFLNIPRISNQVDYQISFSAQFLQPPVFDRLKVAGNISETEMYTTFNMGIGMVVIVPQPYVKKALGILNRYHRTHILGVVCKKEKKQARVLISTKNKTFITLTY